jgi:hypothetical protein
MMMATALQWAEALPLAYDGIRSALVVRAKTATAAPLLLRWSGKGNVHPTSVVGSMIVSHHHLLVPMIDSRRDTIEKNILVHRLAGRRDGIMTTMTSTTHEVHLPEVP